MTTDRAAAGTVFALASASGRAGIAVIRISGNEAGAALRALTRRNLPKPRSATLHAFFDPADGALIDKGLALWFPAPNSFTGEDVAELHLHGGRAVLQAALTALARLPGLRHAAPGDFTRRGFLNGKFDLTGAEAIADLVDAETEAQRRQALRQMDGALARLYGGWRARLMQALAHCEAAIDFADDDLPADLIEAQTAALTALRNEIAAHLADNRRGERLRDGVSIAILGAPNVGKSSLLNLLAQRDAAIVAAQAGTTRDIIEVQLDLGGYPVILADTAGLRETADDIESEGIRRARTRAEQADLKLLLFDSTATPLLDAETLALLDDRSLAVLTKIDLPAARRDARLPGDSPLAPVSLKTGAGVPELLDRLAARVRSELEDYGTPPLTRVRHRAGLAQCLALIDQALDGLARGREAALVAEDARLAMRALGGVTGAVGVEDLLDVIFRDFCIGK